LGEREHHDEFYLHDAARIFDAPLFGEVRRRMAAFLARHGCRSPRDRVLSLGCGDGRVECLMAPLVAAIVGVELSPVAVEQARARAAGCRLANLRFEVGNIEELAVVPGSFDAIWALGVLHHLDQSSTAELVRRSYEALRPGGLFVANDPSARRLIGLFKGLFARAYRAYHSPGERELDPTAARACFRDAGFDPVAVHYNDFFLGPLAWLFPGCPRSCVPAAAALDSILLAVPGLNRTASSFCIVAGKPTT
jgi:SAM-dependent methyltransferase